MAKLTDLQNFCKDKSIIIVGNSSGILNHKEGKLIDSYDIVVRLNRGYQPNNYFYNSLGSKTNILSIGIKSAKQASNVILSNKVNYILSPIIWSDKLSYPNVYDIDHSVYHKLKEDLGGIKPSTGISTFNFFNTLINFKKLDLIGFDFFQTSSYHRNRLGHLLVKDHNGAKEKLFFEKTKDIEKTSWIQLKNINPERKRDTINNMPVYSNHIVKNNKRR